MGAFIANREVMWSLTHQPVLGHITTFGGHPVACAAGLAGMQTLLAENLIAGVAPKEQLFLQLLQHPKIRAVRSKGLMLAVELEDFPSNKKVIDYCIANGVITDWFLFAPQCLRIVPPLIITEDEIRTACKTILAGLDQLV